MPLTEPNYGIMLLKEGVRNMKVITHNVFVIIGAIIALIVATILGIYGQDLSYYFNEQIFTQHFFVSVSGSCFC